ncbi:hypothetical protein KKI24_24985 [bacterium]|nr:hypothetical protein [bacterium]
MTEEKPSTRELVEAVTEFMETRVIPEVGRRTGFHTRVAVNVLKTVARELQLGPELAIGEKERLSAILGLDGSLRVLNTELCRRIREKGLDPQDPRLISHLHQTVMGRLSIDNPRYSAYLKALETG